MDFTGPFTYEQATEPEWVLTNGLGGYASSTLCGLNSRRYHGLLVAALNPPGGRNLLVSKLEELVSVGGKDYPFATNAYPGTVFPEGFRWQRTFALEGDTVCMTFAAGGAELEKRVRMAPNENTTLVTYRNTGPETFTLTLTPLVNARDFHGDTRGEIDMQVWSGRRGKGPAVQVMPSWMAEGFWLYADAGVWQDDRAWYYNMAYCWERRRGLPDLDNHFSPGRFVIPLAPGSETTIILSTAPPLINPLPAEAPAPIAEPLPDGPAEIRRLWQTADSFLVQRGADGGRTVIAGYHWFGDWGRDTMIALPGLCLLRGRYAIAADILRTFAAARRNGLLPNLFLDSGAGEAYNTVDASLWFFDAVHQYFAATGDAALVAELRPALEEIVACYRAGTDFDIRMADDGLIAATPQGWQLTWMDAKVDDWVVTPRTGKPVEINALWYHGLRVMADFAARWGWEGDYAALADRVRDSFQAFWYADGGYLYDVLGEMPDAKLRPNQLLAVSLAHSPLDMEKAKSLVEVVRRELLTPMGMRTLAPGDPDYRGIYTGDRWARDGAYHQGTVWAWLIGPFIAAYLRVHDHSDAAKAEGRRMLQPLLNHVWEAGVGSISEIFDGDPPHAPKGTVSQAWSVAEVLRAWEMCK